MWRREKYLISQSAYKKAKANKAKVPGTAKPLATSEYSEVTGVCIAEEVDSGMVLGAAVVSSSEDSAEVVEVVGSAEVVEEVAGSADVVGVVVVGASVVEKTVV